MRRKLLAGVLTLLTCAACTVPARAQFDLKRALGSASKAVQAVMLTDAQVSAYVKAYIDGSDTTNRVCAADDPYAVRLSRLTEGLSDVEGVALNFKVYRTDEANAFACADGSVRVYSALMDIMSDEELLGVIGHEIGHVALRHSKKAFRTALLTSALSEGIASQGGVAAQLTGSQLGSLGEALVQSSYSRKQERQADDYGYEFLKRSGINPWAMALSFRRLKALQGEATRQGNPLNQLLSTHPDLDSRIERMAKRAKKEGFVEPAASGTDGSAS